MGSLGGKKPCWRLAGPFPINVELALGSISFRDKGALKGESFTFSRAAEPSTSDLVASATEICILRILETECLAAGAGCLISVAVSLSD